MIEASCLQFWNGQLIVFKRHDILILNIHVEVIKRNYIKNINDFIGCSWKCNVNDAIMGLNYSNKYQYLQDINCSYILHNCLANFNSSSTSLIALILYNFFFKKNEK